MTEIRFAPAAGAEIAYADEGAGDPVLLLVHAGVADLRMWDPLLAELGGRRRTLRLDLRGFGATRYEPGSFFASQDVLAVLDHAGVDRVVGVGNSFGGWVVLDTAARHPERFERIVLLAPALPDEGEPSEELRAFGEAEEAAIERGDVDAATQINVDMWAREAPAHIRQLVFEMQSKAFHLQLAAEPEPEDANELDVAGMAIAADVAVGDRDVPDFHANARRLETALPNVRLHTIAGAGHLIPLDRPDAVAALL
jgi:3-oxoadipate enol-lactonase